MSDTVYTEFPGDEIIAVHFKDEKEPPGGGTGGGECGNGWFPWGAYFPGGGGFPPQIVTTQATDMLAGQGVLWNPRTTPPPPADAPWMYTVPGIGSTSETISIVWSGVLPPSGDVPALRAGLWIMTPDHQPYPPYHNAAGEPPPNPPPYNPDISGDVVGDGRISWVNAGSVGATVVATFASSLSGPPARVAKPPFMMRPKRRIASLPVRPSSENLHYGWPGDPPSEGIWIEVEHVCPNR